jgi:hypothetical protein
MGFGWAADHSRHVRCIAAIYPVLNLASCLPKVRRCLGKQQKPMGSPPCRVHSGYQHDN